MKNKELDRVAERCERISDEEANEMLARKEEVPTCIICDGRGWLNCGAFSVPCRCKAGENLGGKAMPEKLIPIYYGWIVVEKAGEGMRDYFFCETFEKGQRVRGAEFRRPEEAINWWDEKIGKPVLLLPTPLGAYRVYTEEPAT
jgi:hypothetical protein